MGRVDETTVDDVEGNIGPEVFVGIVEEGQEWRLFSHQGVPVVDDDRLGVALVDGVANLVRANVDILVSANSRWESFDILFDELDRHCELR